MQNRNEISMSRIGKKPILVPDNVDINIENGNVLVKGPLGELKRFFKDEIKISKEDGHIVLAPKGNSDSARALWGTYASHVFNMIAGVTKGFEKRLIIEGVGFKAALEGQKLSLSLGFSHPIKIDIPEGIKVQTDKNIIIVSGTDKEKVGSFASNVRSLKKPEPYKGKGIRYENEIIRRKAGKKAATTAA